VLVNDESKLIDAALQGEADAFGELVLRYQDRLYSAVVHILGSRSDAEDVVQDAFIQAYVKLDTFKQNSRFYTWLYRIAFNVSISRRRRRRIEISVDEGREVMGAEPIDTSASPTSNLEEEERREQLQAAMSRLTHEHREIIVLRHMEDFSYEEIAEVLELSVGTVRSRLHRARAALLEHLREIMSDEPDA
jgi:RNA polymerase sigma-70 factor, ECF subfamily